jgi:hypothetical protein
MIVPSQVAVRYALGAPLRPLVVTNIYNDPVFTSANCLGEIVILFGSDIFYTNKYIGHYLI